jgi:electron transfer flavoprotein alpha subunit
MVPSPGLVGGTGNESTQAVGEKVAGEDAEVMSANTEDKSEDGQPLTKRRKVASGGRGVANMTPEQLAKKRANGKQHQAPTSYSMSRATANLC